MSRRKEIALVTAGILAGIAVSGPAAQAAAGLAMGEDEWIMRAAARECRETERRGYTST